MLLIAFKNLFEEKTRLLASILGVAFSILLALTLPGVYFGAISQSRAYPENSGADLWIVQEGAADLFHTVSLLPSGLENKLENISQIETATPIINHAFFKSNG